MISAVLVAVMLVSIGGLSILVYRDARDVGVSRPPLWAVLIYGTGLLGLGLYLFVPAIPVPGLLVIVLVAPVLYLFERDDARHGGEPADPHTLADAETTRSDRTDRSSAVNTTGSDEPREREPDDTARKR